MDDAARGVGRGVLVTGTDTGVGKTVVAAGLLWALREAGWRAVGFKPVESGIGGDEPADSEVLRAASAADPDAAPLLRLAEPLAPAVAAERADRVLHPAAVEDRVRTLRARHEIVIVEGAGGLLVPLAWGYNVVDLATRAGLEVVLVARAGLGTLNHILLTVDALRGRGVTPCAIVLNGGSPDPDLAERTNPDVLARLLPQIPVLRVHRIAEATDSHAAARAAAPLLHALVPGRGSQLP